MLLQETTNLLSKKNKTIAVAESCTGGLISNSLTNISGSSKYFNSGIVLYSDETKSKILRINRKSINKYGTVSKKIALLMAKKIRKLFNADIGLSTTGIAGPTGGTKNTPLGTVYIGISYKDSNFVKRFKFSGSRIQIKNKAKDKALLLIKKCLENH